MMPSREGLKGGGSFPVVTKRILDFSQHVTSILFKELRLLF